MHCCSSDVLRAIDDFCISRHWMMHVGPEKGDILVGALKSSILAQMMELAPPPPPPPPRRIMSRSLPWSWGRIAGMHLY